MNGTLFLTSQIDYMWQRHAELVGSNSKNKYVYNICTRILYAGSLIVNLYTNSENMLGFSQDCTLVAVVVVFSSSLQFFFFILKEIKGVNMCLRLQMNVWNETTILILLFLSTKSHPAAPQCERKRKSDDLYCSQPPVIYGRNEF